ncbi:hypothetical protein BAY01_04835 [Elizabethkingia miricola]|nr:hypothetical protein BAY01_04835 [Elizabethkingia miricola]
MYDNLNFKSVIGLVGFSFKLLESPDLQLDTIESNVKKNKILFIYFILEFPLKKKGTDFTSAWLFLIFVQSVFITSAIKLFWYLILSK